MAKPKKLDIRAFEAKARAMREWRAANPKLAQAWDEALAEDAARRAAALAESERAEEQQRRRQVLLEAAPQRLLDLGAPLRAVDAWRSELDASAPGVRAVRRMLAEGKSFCLLSGKPGGGKTVAAVVAMADRLLEARDEDLPALFVRAGEGAQLGFFSARDRELLEQMRTAGLLVVDDLGPEALFDGSIWKSILDDVVDVRYSNRLPTVLTTNLDAEQFRKRYGGRIADRVRHAGILEDCGSESRRKKGEG